MSLLNNSADALANESVQILGVFTKTLRKLTSLNERISKKEDDIQAEIAKKGFDLASLECAREANERVIGKIKEIIS